MFYLKQKSQKADGLFYQHLETISIRTVEYMHTMWVILKGNSETGYTRLMCYVIFALHCKAQSDAWNSIDRSPTKNLDWENAALINYFCTYML